MRRSGYALLAAVLPTCLGACSGGSSPTAGGAGGEAGAGGGAIDQCVSAPDGLFAARQFGESDLIRQIIADGDTLYFRTLDALMKVPTAGGEPQLVADLSAHPPSEFWVLEDTLLLRSTADLLTVPKSGGPAVASGPALSPSPTNFAATQVADGAVYWLASDSKRHGIYRRELAGTTTDKLYETADELHGLQLVAGNLYFVNTTAHSIQSLPVAGGSPESVIDADGDDAILSADAANLYVSGVIGASTSTNYGLYRQPISGAAPAHLVTGLFSEDTTSTANTRAGAYFAAPANVSLNHADPSDVSPALLFAAPSDSETAVRWCIDSSYTVHALAVQGSTAYVSVYKTSANQATIARVLMP